MNRLFLALLLLACATSQGRAQGLPVAEAPESRARAQGREAPHAAKSGPMLGGAERSDAGRAWLSGSHAELAARQAADAEGQREQAAQVEGRVRGALADHAARLMGAENVQWAGLDAVKPPVAPPATGNRKAGVGNPPAGDAAASQDGPVMAPARGAPIESSVPPGSPWSRPGAGAAIPGSSAVAVGAALSGSPYEAAIQRAAAEHDVAVELVRAVVKVESNFRADARSPKGAMGLMQLMPATARRFGATDPADPHTNVRAGTAYLRWLLARYDGDLSLALAGYNAGEGAVERYGRQIPPFRETREYVAKVLAHYSAAVGAPVGASAGTGGAAIAGIAGNARNAGFPVAIPTVPAGPAIPVADAGSGAGSGAGGSAGEGGALQMLARFIEAALPLAAARHGKSADNARGMPEPQAVPLTHAGIPQAMGRASAAPTRLASPPLAVAQRRIDSERELPRVTGRFERAGVAGAH